MWFSYWKSLDATSAMSFFSPAMDNVKIGGTCTRRCRSASARSSRPAVMDNFEFIMFAHTTLGVLSHNIPMWQCWRFGMMASKTSHPRSIPVSSRSEFLIFPFYYFLMPNGCGPLMGIGLTTQLGENDVFRLSTIPLHQVMTRPWILYIVGRLVRVSIFLSFSGRCCSVSLSNLLVWFPVQRPCWCWWC